MSDVWTRNKTKTANQDGLSLIWRRFPEWQRQSSTVWWFFLLFPKGPEGYGPRQMMFTIVGRVGKKARINGIEFDGLAHPPAVNGGGDEHFPGMTLGWILDGQTMHEGVIHQPAPVTLSPNGFVSAWSPETGFGGEIREAGDKPFNLAARFVGQKGAANFEVWGDAESPLTSPAETVNIHTLFGGCHSVGWQHLHFQGQFTAPSGTEQLEGIGYFQRVCLNFPPFPWKWIWGLFEDGTVFSSFNPYVGLNLLRQGDWFFPNLLERPAIPVTSSAFLYLPGRNERVRFDKSQVKPIIGRGPFPQFEVHYSAKNGDFMRYRIEPYSHAQVLLDRPVLSRFWLSRYNYNEYIFRLRDLSGRVNGQALDSQKLGNGFGNIEYTWSFGF